MRSLKAHAPIARVLVFPVSAFFHEGGPLTQLSRFLSLLRERNSGAAGPSQWVRAMSRRLSARVSSPPRVLSSCWCVSHKKTSAPLRLRMAWSLLMHLKRTSSSRTLLPTTRCPLQRLMQKNAAKSLKSFLLLRL